MTDMTEDEVTALLASTTTEKEGALHRNRFTGPYVAPEGMKRCCRCQTEQPVDQFSKNRATLDGLDKRCKSCKKQIRAEKAEYNRDYLKAWKENHPDYMPEYQRKWSAENRLKENARLRPIAAKRRQQMALDALVEEVDYNEILIRDNYMCHICGKHVEPADVEFDHVIPLSRGGTHTMDNVKVSHGVCNRRKGAKVTATIKAG